MNPLPPPPTSDRAPHVLVVDDDDFMLEFVADMLRRAGASTVATASDGKRALDLLAGPGPAPDIVVCDLQMPNRDGFQLMEALARDGYGGAIILISGQADRVLHSASLMAQFHQLRVLGALHKPIDKLALVALLAQWRAPA